MSDILEKIKPQIVRAHEGDVACVKNPMEALTARGLISSVGRGLFVLRGELATLLSAIEGWVGKIAQGVGASPIWVPSLLSQDNMKKTKYLDSFLDQALLIQEARDSKVLGMACPTVCYHYFASLSAMQVMKEEVITALGKCFRQEVGELSDLGRLTNFTMREIVGVGSESYCLSKIVEVQERMVKLFSETLGLSFEVATASDRFFGPNEEIKKKSQLLAQSKLEIQAVLPYNQQRLAIGSLNRHGDVFFRNFSIKGSESLQSSFCVGFGYERILFAILAQKGTDFTSEYYRQFLSQ